METQKEEYHDRWIFTFITYNISYPQIMKLQDLHCFVRLPGHYPITQLTLDLGFRTTKNNGFIERSMPTTFNFSQLTSKDC